MGRPVWKVALGYGVNRLSIEGEPFAAGLDGQGQPAAWFLAEPGQYRDVVLQVAYTGDDVPEHAEHLSTFTGRKPLTGGLLFHVWRLPRGS